ncbi:Nuclear receptor 2C2-associated protein [Coemansia erecta]|uniref:Nuclear receptor 2C2-associated protein n=1 Tax=Coemansia erecta TaxID=147472 RepID=A0A9W8CV56_9FUNG|nr:Nuclear receptor 2C2-associated protein [Coemansia erecta]
MDEQSLVPLIAQTRVSSVLNRDGQSYGRQHLFDGSLETCWTSDQGTPQHIDVRFSRPVHLHRMHVQFQGGFAGKTARLIDRSTGREICPMHFLDNNSRQTAEVPEEVRRMAYAKVGVVFPESTDFYGRVVVYMLDFVGRPAASAADAKAESAQAESAQAAPQTAGAHVVIS